MIRADLEVVLERTKKLYNLTTQTGALIQVRWIKSLSKPMNKKLNEWQLPEENIEYLKALAEKQVLYWEARKELKDDLLPSIGPWYGIAEHTAFIGGKVEFTPETSYNHPIIQDMKEVKDLTLRENATWLQMLIQGMEYYQEHWSDQFIVKLRGADGPMDIANVIRGNDLLYEFYDNEESVHELMEFATEAAKFTLEHQRKYCTQIGGGIVSGFELWLPEKGAGHLSDDLSCMCSEAIYEEFGLPYLKKLASYYEHVFLHTHSLGKKNIPQFVTIPQIKYIEISNDPNADRAIKVLEEYSALLQDKIVILQLTSKEIKENLELLKKHKCVIWYEASDLRDAQDIVEVVHKELPIR